MFRQVARKSLQSSGRLSVTRTSQRSVGMDLGMYNVSYKWGAYQDPVFTAIFQTVSLGFLVFIFYHSFYDGDHHLPGRGSVIRPKFQHQMDALYLNEELGLPSAHQPAVPAEDTEE
ncbi:unnamed protein product [Oikopleura dioica]|uniref:Uncharacterized protein n=1 Tax=Oikopleura dioica TaxID=34765 RepID=E4X5I0_OIKDI|nr:unnamed protein product [Oikopleura dioica]CBY39093.1 unnamed protein product [Oikopleura dioica]